MNAIRQDKSVKAFLHKELIEYSRTIGRLSIEEKKDLLEWVKSGNSVYSNPFLMSDDNGRPMDYIEACRVTADMTDLLDDAPF